MLKNFLPGVAVKCGDNILKAFIGSMLILKFAKY